MCAVPCDQAPLEVLNDINGDLVALYRCVRHHLDEFVRQFRWALVSRQMLEWARMERPGTLTDIQRAARFYYLQKLAFGGKMSGQTFGVVAAGAPRLNLLRIEEELSAAHLRLANVVVEHLPWAQCVERYDKPGTLFYMVGDRGIRGRLCVARVRAPGAAATEHAGQGGGVDQRSPADPHVVRGPAGCFLAVAVLDRHRRQPRQGRWRADH